MGTVGDEGSGGEVEILMACWGRKRHVARNSWAGAAHKPDSKARPVTLVASSPNALLTPLSQPPPFSTAPSNTFQVSILLNAAQTPLPWRCKTPSPAPPTCGRGALVMASAHNRPLVGSSCSALASSVSAALLLPARCSVLIAASHSSVRASARSSRRGMRWRACSRMARALPTAPADSSRRAAARQRGTHSGQRLRPFGGERRCVGRVVGG